MCVRVCVCVGVLWWWWVKAEAATGARAFLGPSGAVEDGGVATTLAAHQAPTTGREGREEDGYTCKIWRGDTMPCHVHLLLVTGCLRWVRGCAVQERKLC